MYNVRVNLNRSFGVAALVAVAALAPAQTFRIGWQSSTSFGNVDTNVARSTVVDPQGNVLVVGEATMQRGPGSADSDVLIRKFSPAGVLLWTRNFDAQTSVGPTPRPDTVGGAAVDRFGNLYIAGVAAPPATSSADFFLMKVSPTGALSWTRIWNPGPENALAAGVLIDRVDAPVLFGRYNQPSFEPAAAVAKYSPTGAIAWSRAWLPIGAAAAEVTTAVVLPNNDLALGGRAKRRVTGYDSWVTRIAGTTAATVWSNFSASIVQPNNSETATAITADALGNVYVGGSVAGTSGFAIARHVFATGARNWYQETAPGGFTTTVAGIAIDRRNGDVVFGGSARNNAGGPLNQDFFVARYSALGVARWTRYIPAAGVSPREIATGFAYEPEGFAYVVGSTSENALGPERMFVAKVSQLGTLEWSYRHGSFPNSINDRPMGFGYDRFAGSLYLAGGPFASQAKGLRVLNLVQRPVATNDAYVMQRNTTLTVADIGVYANDRYWRFANVVPSAPSVGTLTFRSTGGGFTYRPPVGFVGTATFTYSLSRIGMPSSVASVTIRVQ